MRAPVLYAIVVFVSVAAGPRDALTRARQLYNQQQYDAAITAAAEARQSPRVADAALLVLARAHLERFRASADPADLVAARSAFGEIRPTQLTPLDRLELMIGLGVSLYLDDQAGAAAEEFDLALAGIGEENLSARERVLDWWASALDRQAQLGPRANQPSLYARIVSRMENELRLDAGSAAGSYWLVAGARGSGDLERAWAAAVAAWARASLAGERRAALRADLDRIVTEAIIPERARRLSVAEDSAQLSTALHQEWDAVKQDWNGN